MDVLGHRHAFYVHILGLSVFVFQETPKTNFMEACGPSPSLLYLTFHLFQSMPLGGHAPFSAPPTPS